MLYTYTVRKDPAGLFVELTHQFLTSLSNYYRFSIIPGLKKKSSLKIALAKRGLQNFYKWDPATALDYEAYALSITMQSEDVKEGFAAFLEKREPNFEGK